MYIRLLILFFFALQTALFFAPIAFCAPIDEWNALILDGSKYKFDGQYKAAAQPFTTAVVLAEKQKLPDKCLPISLCRLAEIELLSGEISEADSHFQKIIDLIKTQKEANKLDPQVNFWALALADAYQANTRLSTRETCLKHACYLKGLIYGIEQKESTDCFSKLADCYIDEGKIDKAIPLLVMTKTITDEQFKKDPDHIGEMLNQLAIKFSSEHKYKQAEQLELTVIKTAKTSTGYLGAGLPAFYSLLGTNALAQGKTAESKKYFETAISECPKIRSSHKKQFGFYASHYLELLYVSASANLKTQKPTVTETELRQILAVNKAAFRKPYNYGPLNVLSRTLFLEGRNEEGRQCLMNAIAIAKSNSFDVKDVPALYLTLALNNADSTRVEQANEAFANALKAEKDKRGFHATLVLFWWGYQLKQNSLGQLSSQKWNLAFTQAGALPPEKRGTLLADLLQMAAYSQGGFGKEKKSQLYFQKSKDEIQLQKKLNSKLGPDFFKRL